MTLILATITTMLCKDMPLIFQVQEGPVVVIAAQDDAATLTAITAIRTSVGIILHMAQVHGAFTTLTGAAIDLHVIYKVRFHLSGLLEFPDYLDFINYCTNICKDTVQLT